VGGTFLPYQCILPFRGLSSNDVVLIRDDGILFRINTQGTHTLPSAPPSEMGIWHVTQRVWQSCVLPVRNSPNTSVRDPVSIPPSRSLSNSVDPVVSVTSDFRSSRASAAVLKSMGTKVLTISFSLTTFASERLRTRWCGIPHR